MEKIETRTTKERLLRSGFALLLFAGFGAYYAYDGYYGYVQENLDATRQAIPEPRPEHLQANPKVTREHLDQVDAGMPVERMRELLGEPNLVHPPYLRFVGKEIQLLVYFDREGKVASVVKEPTIHVEGEEANFMVTEERAGRIEKGMSETDVVLELGRMAESSSEIWWYVGPAAYGSVPVIDGKVADRPKVQVSPEHSAFDIKLQKIIALVLGVVSLYLLFMFIRVLLAHAVLDDQGLRLNGRLIAWDEMARLDSEDYRDRGIVVLHYTHNGRPDEAEIDSYHYARFKPMIEAICRRKDWPSPFDQAHQPSASEMPDSDGE